MRNVKARLDALEAEHSERAQPGEALTTFAYGGERRRLQTDDSGRVVYSWEAVIAALGDNAE